MQRMPWIPEFCARRRMIGWKGRLDASALGRSVGKGSLQWRSVDMYTLNLCISGAAFVSSPLSPCVITDRPHPGSWLHTKHGHEFKSDAHMRTRTHTHTHVHTLNCLV